MGTNSWAHPCHIEQGNNGINHAIHRMCLDPTQIEDPFFFSSVGDNEIFRWNAGSRIYDKVFRVNNGSNWSLPLERMLEGPLEFSSRIPEHVRSPNERTYRSLLSIP